MSGSNGELSAWESAKLGHADLLDGSPMTEQIASRITRVRRVASDILWLRESDEAWPAEPHPALGGLEPSALATASEAGCQAVLRLLDSLRRPDAEES